MKSLIDLYFTIFLWQVKRFHGNIGLSMYLPPSVTSITIPGEFLEPGTSYNWEVLAIEESGNQTLSSSAFRTQ